MGLKNCCEHTVFVGVAISRTCGVFGRAVVVLGRLRRSDRRGCVIAIRIFIFRMNQLERVYQIIQNLAERKWIARVDFLKIHVVSLIRLREDWLILVH